MIFVFYGGNRSLMLAKVKSIEESFRKKVGSSAPVFRFDGDNFTPADFEHALRAESMFDEKRLVLARDLLSDKENSELVLNILKKKPAAAVTAVFYDTKVSGNALEKFNKLGAKVKEYKSFGNADENRRKSRTLFQFSDMLMAKNRYAAFAAYHRARSEGFGPEDIFWGVYHQFKNMLLVSHAANIPPFALQEETNLHPFVIKKCQSFLKNFTRGELEQKFERLIFLWSDVISGSKDLSAELELFILLRSASAEAPADK